MAAATSRIWATIDTPLKRRRSARRSRRMVSSGIRRRGWSGAGAGGGRRGHPCMAAGAVHAGSASRQAGPGAAAWTRGLPGPAVAQAGPPGGLLGVADSLDQLLVVFLVVLGIGRLDRRGECIAIDLHGDFHAFFAQLLDAGFLDVVDVIAHGLRRQLA